MSDSDSEKSVIISPVKVVKFNGYTCDKCDYKTKKLKSFISHITRKVPLKIMIMVFKKLWRDIKTSQK